MTAGLADVQAEDDILVESAMTKLLAVRAAREVEEHCRAILGDRAYSEEEPFAQVNYSCLLKST